VVCLFDGVVLLTTNLVQNTIGRHPVVILSSPDERGLVKVASMSHQHPNNPPQKPTSIYNLPTQIHPAKGEGTVNVGRPNLVHFWNLKQTSATTTSMTDHNLEVLKKDIGES